MALVGFFLYNAAKAGVLDKYLNSFKSSPKSVSSNSSSTLASMSYERLDTMDVDPESSPRVSKSLLTPEKSIEMPSISTNNQTSVSSPSDRLSGMVSGMNNVNNPSLSSSSTSSGSTSIKRFSYKV